MIGWILPWKCWKEWNLISQLIIHEPCGDNFKSKSNYYASPPPNSSTCGKTHLQIIDRRNLLRVIMSRNWRTCSACSRNRRPKPCNWHATSKQRLTQGYIRFFFKELEAIVEDLTATDERRHGVAHLSQFLSISDLMKQVKPRVPEGTNIPLESTVIYAFAPPTMYKKTSQYYNGHVQLKHAIQRRQLRAFHTDAHWCVALYWYLRELAIQNWKKCVFISCEDKTKIDFDEPGAVVSSGVRRKRSFIRTISMLGALDHDVNQKGKFKTIFFLKISVMCLSKLVKVGSFISYTASTSTLHLFCFS